MPDSVTTNIDSPEAFNEMFDKLDIYQMEETINAGLKVQAEMVAAEARNTAPVRSGRLRQGIRVRKGRKSPGFYSYNAMLRAKQFDGEDFYAVFVEFGHKQGKRLRRKATTGPVTDERKDVPGVHYMETAFGNVLQRAQQAQQETWRRKIDEIAAAGGER